MAAIGDQSPIEFSISNAGQEYIDLSSTQIYVQAEIRNQDGTALAADIEVGPVNYWLNSLFSQVDLSLNEKLVTHSSNTYPYRCMIESLLSFGPAAKNSQLQSSVYFKDTAGQMDNVADLNTGLVSRRNLTETSRSVDMIGRLHLDMMFQPRFLINGVHLKIRLIRSPNAFNLMAAANNYKVVLKEVALFVRQIKLSPAVQMAHIKALEKAPVKYPINRVEVKVFSVSRGNLQANIENIFMGQLPKRIIIGFVDNDSFNGNIQKNPFNFKNYGINFLALFMDGTQIPSRALTPSFPHRYIRSYETLFSGSGQSFLNSGNDISRGDYPNGYCLFSFDISPDYADSSHFDLRRSGVLRLETKFAVALPNTINIVIWAELENVITVDKFRNVLFDYQ